MCGGRAFIPSFLFKIVCRGIPLHRSDAWEKNLLEQYRSVDLVLKEDGTFELTAIEKRGKTRKAGGEYSYDEENELLIFTAKFFGKNRTKTVFIQDGTFVIEHKIVGKNLVLKFRLGG